MKIVDTPQNIQKLAIPIKNGYSFHHFSSIIYCEAEINYTHFHFIKEDELTLAKPLKKVAEFLTNHGFFRIHQSYLINLEHIIEYNKINGGSIVLTNGTELPVARSKKKVFLEIIEKMKA